MFYVIFWKEYFSKISQIEDYWNKILEQDEFENFYDVIKFLLKRLCHRKFHLFDWSLLNLAYSLTAGGRVHARQILIKNGYRLQEDKYDSMKGLDPILIFELKSLKYKFNKKQINREKNDIFEPEYESINRDENPFQPNCWKKHNST